MKRRNSMLAVAVMCLAAVFAMGDVAEAVQKLKLAAYYPAGYYGNKGYIRVADRIRKATNGQVDIQVYESGQLGGYEQAFQEVMRGTIDMTTNFPTSRFNKKFEIACTPSLANGFDEVFKLFTRGSPYHNFMEAAYKECGVVYIGSFVDTLMGSTMRKGKTIENPFDTSNKQFLMRVLPVNAVRKWFSAMGYQMATVPYAEVFSSLQTGILDGDSGSGPEGVYIAFKDAVGGYIEYLNMFVMLDFVVSEKAWNSFDAKTKKIVSDSFDAEKESVYLEAKKSYNVYLEKLRNEGVKIITPTKAQLDFMDDLARKESWPVCAKYTGQKVLDDIQKYLGKKK